MANNPMDVQPPEQRGAHASQGGRPSKPDGRTWAKPAHPTARPLEGLTVVDLTRHMAGPYASLVLGDFGAEVIKVESAPHGDPLRRIGVSFIGEESSLFLAWNRNKRSICVDLRRPEGVEVVVRLVDGADVFMENYRPGVAASMGLGPEQLLERNPRLVYCSVNAFGSTGPWATRPGTDPVVQAMSGVMSVTGEPGGGPLLVGVPVADFAGAMVAVQAVLLGLLARGRTGRGQWVEAPMLHALAFALSTRFAQFAATGQDPERLGGRHSQVVPYQVFAAKDGWVVAGTWGERDWAKFCDALGCPELAEDPGYDTNAKRIAQREELVRYLEERFQARTIAEWEQRFAEAGALFAPVNSFSQLVAHPQAAALGLTAEVEHPLGRLRQLTVPIHMSESPPAIRRPPPLLGEHTEEILLERGWSQAEVERLVARGIVRVARREAAPQRTARGKMASWEVPHFDGLDDA
jgi:crotonobetainyl-CoA:carnitine CoA-transferase CaiB-like acyl-CoA transferase